MQKSLTVIAAVFVAMPAIAQISHSVNLQIMTNQGHRDESWAHAASKGHQVGVYIHQLEPFPEFEYIAPLWDGTAKGRVDLRPKGAGRTELWDVFEGKQVGVAYFNDPFHHALVWNSAPEDYIDLHVDTISGLQLNRTHAFGIHGNQQVGYGAGTGVPDRALMWSGSAASALDLHPATLGLRSSRALKTDGSQQVGYGFLPDNNTTFALLWEGTAKSAVNLAPAGASGARANDVADGRQVGWVRFGENLPRAYVWEGTVESGTDLTPSWATGAGIEGTNGNWHVGWYTKPGAGNNRFAAMWKADTLEFFDLHPFLPANWQAFPSEALGIDELGNVVGYGSSPGLNPFDKRAVMWVVPEPSTVAVLGTGFALLFLRFKRRS